MKEKDEAAIDRALAALGRAAPPEGMEARLSQRLRYTAAQAGSGAGVRRPAKTWWFGALTGAAVATLVCCAIWFGLRGLDHATATNEPPARTSAQVPPLTHVVGPKAEVPCATPALHRTSSPAKAPVLLRAAAEPEKPVHQPSDELTPQERELVRLAQVANPHELSAMTSEARARADLQQAAAFKEFFTPPPPPPHDEGANE